MTVTRKPVSTATATVQAPERARVHHADSVVRPDAASIQQFYERHVDGLYALVMCRVRGDTALAEDVVQDTFLEALHRRADYDPQRGSPQAWLWTLSRNVLRRHLRHHPRRRELAALQEQLVATCDGLQSALQGELASDELIERRETRELVAATIANLAPKHRQVLERKYLDGTALTELAAELEVSDQAVKSLLARARRAFRRAFLELTDVTAMPGPRTAGEHAAGEGKP